MAVPNSGRVADVTFAVESHGELSAAGRLSVLAAEATHFTDSRFLYRWSASILTMLIDCRRYFSGDLDQLVIYLIFAMGELARRTGGGQPKGINALSVADITQIPRETTRRKLRELAALDRLRCGPDGLWYLGEAAGMERLTASVTSLLEEARQHGRQAASSF